MGTDLLKEIKLKVKPVFIDFNHDYVYEGPCRFGKGEALTPQFDRMISGEIYKAFLHSLEMNLPDFAQTLEAVRVQQYVDDFIVHEDDMQELLKDSCDVDLYLVSSSGRYTNVLLEFARRCNKPIAVYNEVLFAVTTDTAALKVRGLEVYPFYDWQNSQKILKALRVRKALGEVRLLSLNRFSTDFSPVSSQDGFLSLDKVMSKLNVKMNVMNIHEYLDQLEVIPPDQNHSTPGRHQENITEADMAEIEKITDGLIAAAKECEMTRENLIPSVRAYYLTKKLLKSRDCNAFTAPCADICSTRRLNQEQCTLCLTHSLLEEEGVSSACETDFNALISKVILSTLSLKSTYMGNSAWLRIVDGKITAPDFSGVTEEEFEPIKDIPNLAVTLHSVPNRNLKGYDMEKEEFSIRSFAYSGWGATMRYDFSKDIDTPVTLLRIDPTCEKMFVVSGKIKGQFGLKRQNCSMAAVYQVTDVQDFYEKQFDFGSHMALVYGDYAEELKTVGDVLGMEVVFA